MTDEFRDCFVGERGYEVLKQLMKNGNEFCCSFAKCLQERSEAETAYAQTLRRTSDSLQKLAGRTKGTMAQALATLSSQTSQEADAHTLLASSLMNEISMPMKNLAEAQAKERKSIDDTLKSKFKDWNGQKDRDYKYRAQQSEKCREIESLTNKASELSNNSRSSSRSKASSVSTPLVMSCVPVGRYASVSDKTTSHTDMKMSSNLEASINKAEEDLKEIERKYQKSTKEVELLRQDCDGEMQRSCDRFQKIEFDRITEIDTFIKTYSTSILSLAETMRQITLNLNSIQISASNDIIVQARSNTQPAELEILLYDIYAENEDNVMSKERRILSLMNWISMLKRDLEIHQQTRNKNLSSSTSRSEKSNDVNEDEDGAMCSTSSSNNKDVVRRHQDNSSSSSNDDDGGMYRSKRSKKKKEGTEGSSNEILIDRRGVAVLEQFYRASLYKIECVYNGIKNLPKPTYEHSQRLTKTYTDKGCSTTFLRLPTQSLAQTPASAPSTVHYFAQAMPTLMTVAAVQQSAPMAYTMQRQAAAPTPILYAMQTQAAPAPAPPAAGWTVNEPPLARAAPENQSAKPYKTVRAMYDYKAQHKDELDLKTGDIIVVTERRKDDWFQGILNNKTGLFPGNYVEDV